jgi:hypothetical protein
MKNIHVLPTDKPSRLVKNGNNKLYFTIQTLPLDEDIYCYPQNIYITSDEEIKEGEWVIQINFEKTNTQIIKCQTESQTIIANSKNGSFTKNKIILTTDQDLIKDGVQAIDDDFLEWFVKNPSCEWVEVEHNYIDWIIDNYKIIIPQEEPKQETLEEAAERTYQKGLQDDIDLSFYDGVRLGAKWQAERMYSEEEVEQIFNIGQMIKNYGDYKPYTFKEALEQFKKK